MENFISQTYLGFQNINFIRNLGKPEKNIKRMKVMMIKLMIIVIVK